MTPSNTLTRTSSSTVTPTRTNSLNVSLSSFVADPLRLHHKHLLLRSLLLLRYLAAKVFLYLQILRSRTPSNSATLNKFKKLLLSITSSVIPTITGTPSRSQMPSFSLSSSVTPTTKHQCHSNHHSNFFLVTQVLLLLLYYLLLLLQVKPILFHFHHLHR